MSKVIAERFYNKFIEITFNQEPSIFTIYSDFFSFANKLLIEEFLNFEPLHEIFVIQ